MVWNLSLIAIDALVDTVPDTLFDNDYFPGHDMVWFILDLVRSLLMTEYRMASNAHAKASPSRPRVRLLNAHPTNIALSRFVASQAHSGALRADGQASSKARAAILQVCKSLKNSTQQNM